MIFLGDIHRKFKKLEENIIYFKITDTNIIQVGDLGAGLFWNEIEGDYTAEKLEDLNNFLLNRNIHLYGIRGNHDDPNYFKGTYNFSNLHLLPDYTVLELEGKRILFVGGAISIDREKSIKEDRIRREKHPNTASPSWWKDEIFVLEKDKVKDLTGIDIVVTHCAPNFVEPFGVDSPTTHLYFPKDPKLRQELITERNEIAKLYSILQENKNNIKYWFYGHFHFSSKMYYDSTLFHLLDIDEFYELK